MNRKKCFLMISIVKTMDFINKLLNITQIFLLTFKKNNGL